MYVCNVNIPTFYYVVIGNSTLLVPNKCNLIRFCVFFYKKEVQKI